MTVNTNSSADNIKQIQKQFNDVIAYSQGYEQVQTDELFKRWYDAKFAFIEAWGGNLIYEMPDKVTFDLSQRDKDSRLDDFICVISAQYNNERLADFIESNREGFFNNKVVKETVVYDDDLQKHIVPVGTKLLKAFKHFETDPIILDEIQTRASMIIQENKIDGYVCFSVHPLDFLSTSENTYSWRSCHALDGDYRAGNLSYMMDKSTIVCYLRGAEGVKLPNFPESVPWNSKKWRMLLFFSENWNVLFAGRQYPFFSRTALNVVSTGLMLNTFSRFSHWSYWHDDYLDTFNYKENNYDGGQLMWQYACIENELYKLPDIVKDDENSLHFNDLLRSSFYTKPYYCYRYYSYNLSSPKIVIGGAVPCCNCGKSHIAAPDTFLCASCELDFGTSEDSRFGYCDCCDRRIIVDDAYYLSRYNMTICDSCYEEKIITCPECNEEYWVDEAVYDKDTHHFKCRCCIQRATSNKNDWFDFSEDDLPF